MRQRVHLTSTRHDRIFGMRRYRCGFTESEDAASKRLRRAADGDMDVCKRCDYSSSAEEEFMERQAEKQVNEGVLDEDMGRNRQYNEY